ncbi:hypothetical protein EZV73_24785 [Acidaminobacter sp. JC074]|uniref:DUF5684 domain-containing protein n=1 Tax=Acidaminobacter sp. JC074 TaxID=2530199 RepID=UPI001F0CE04C|nr:DUF5684 domain-containing protein [Acidaminobacter sp. JC074]MCH4890819.1 hypothetical protein [Acidaminobacter sp. JC074]
MNYSGAELGAFAFFSSGFFLLWLGMIVVSIIAMWKVFEKADVDGWKSLIPFLNIWEMLKISGLNPLFILLLLVPLINGVIGIYFAYKFVESYGFGIGGFLLYFFFTPFFMLYMGFSSEVEYVGNYYES